LLGEFVVNLFHRYLCRSSSWRTVLRDYVVPWVLTNGSLGSNVLELGPGYGLTTELLRQKIEHITALEVDPALATALAAHSASTNVTVVHGDATAMPLNDAQFSGAVCLHMLHHVNSAESQDQLFREVWRVLKPGGVFAGVDSLGFDRLRMRVIHWNDTCVPVDPATLAPRLERAGFRNVSVNTNPYAFRFYAQRPSVGEQSPQ
jgi:ubiquinone/menaquinone biosynthesis C-methylase UbiE